MNQILLFLYFFIFCSFSALCEEVKNPIPNSIVKILTFSQKFNQAMPWLNYAPKESSGSGFVIEGNTILTNAHVVSHSKYLEIKKQDSPKKYVAKIKYISHPSDIAELEVLDTSFFDGIEPLKLGAIPSLNTTAQTIGFPIGGEKISITTGIISRIEKIIYSHSQVDEHLAIQTDAAINPGNSGGPVLQDGLVVGMAFQGIRQGDNIGYMIPTTIINHFITDAKDGKIDGTPEVGVFYNRLPPVMRSFLKLPEHESGIIVIATHPQSPVTNVLKKNDVLTRINGCIISDEGTIKLDGIRVPFYEIVERSQYYDKISLVWYREGQMLDKEITLTPFHRPLSVGSDYIVAPEYFIFAGLTFINLSGDFFRSFSKEWWNDIPLTYRLLYYYQTLLNKDKNRRSYVTLSQVLSASHNSHARKYKNEILEEVNGEKILSLKNVRDVISKTDEDFFTFKFMNNPTPLILEKDKAYSINQSILEKYRISVSSRLKENN